MYNIENRFKTASVGGFVKSEVIGYIESMEQEYLSKLGTLERIVAATQTARNELEGRLQQHERNTSQETMENKRLKSMLADVQDQLADKEQALGAALIELERLQGKQRASEGLQREITEARIELESLRDSEQAMQQRLQEQNTLADEALRDENTRIQMELDNQREALQRLHQDNAELREKLNESSALQQELDAQSEMIQKMHKENEELRTKIEEAATTVHASDIPSSLLLDMQTQMDTRNRQLIVMNQELEQMRERCQNFEDAIGTLESVESKALQIEANACEKASAMVSATVRESDKLKENLDALLHELDASYRQVTQEAERKVGRVYDELEKAKAAMARITDAHSDGFAQQKRPILSVVPGFGDAKHA